VPESDLLRGHSFIAKEEGRRNRALVNTAFQPVDLGRRLHGKVANITARKSWRQRENDR
jgi:hypothetical protein